MTQFRRSGFWRYSKFGNLHWVTEHDVERDEWNSTGGREEKRDYFRSRLRELRADGSATARYVNPNAECPVCGAAVFFYQNSYGSRVFFDELGKPWPRHPCTIGSPPGTSANPDDRHIVAPTSRDETERAHINSCFELAGLDSAEHFRTVFELDQWQPLQLLATYRKRRNTLHVFSVLETGETKRRFLAVRRPCPFLAVGSIAFYYSGWLTYFNPTSMEPVDIEVSTLRGASHFIDEMALLQAVDSAA